MSGMIFKLAVLLLKEYANKQASKDKLEDTSNKQGKGLSIAILGTKGAGKTTLLNTLRNKAGEKTFVTSYESYQDFDYKKADGTIVHIQKGWDIGGGNLYKKEYESMIENADLVFYLFDINKLIEDEEEKREIYSRLEFITRKCISNKKRLVTLLTHSDKLKRDLQEVMRLYRDDVYKRDNGSYKAAVTDYHFEPINMTNELSVRQLLDKLL